jgi:hypothetical protein
LVYFAKGTDRKGKVVELGGLKAAVEAMRKFDADAEVQRGGADVLAWMANSPHDVNAAAGNRKKIASEGGIEVFLKAVRGFPDNEKVLELNLVALGNVAAGNPDNVVKIAEKGGIELAIEAWKRHPDVLAENLIHFLFWVSKSEKSHAAIAKGRDALLAAKKATTNASDKRVQVRAKEVLDLVEKYNKNE